MCYLTVCYFYEVLLFIAERKACYDKYGEYGLKEGIPNAKGCNQFIINNIIHRDHWWLQIWW